MQQEQSDQISARDFEFLQSKWKKFEWSLARNVQRVKAMELIGALIGVFGFEKEIVQIAEQFAKEMEKSNHEPE